MSEHTLECASRQSLINSSNYFCFDSLFLTDIKLVAVVTDAHTHQKNVRWIISNFVTVMTLSKILLDIIWFMSHIRV